MTSGYYDEDGVYIDTATGLDEEQILNMLCAFALNGVDLSNEHREILIMAGYDPDTGEYNE